MKEVVNEVLFEFISSFLPIVYSILNGVFALILLPKA